MLKNRMISLSFVLFLIQVTNKDHVLNTVDVYLFMWDSDPKSLGQSYNIPHNGCVLLFHLEVNYLFLCCFLTSLLEYNCFTVLC